MRLLVAVVTLLVFSQGWAQIEVRATSVSRGSFTADIVEAIALPLSSARCFSDIGPWSDHAAAICSAADIGLIHGFPDGSFRAAAPIRIRNALVLTSRAFGTDLRELATRLGLEPNDSSYLSASVAADLVTAAERSRAETVVLPVRMQRRSEGCGSAPPPVTLSSVELGGRDRGFISVRPDNYDPDRAYPLIVAFHGRTNPNTMVRTYFGLEPTDSALIIYPSGIPRGDSFSWSDPGDPSYALRDYELFDALVNLHAATYCLNLERVFLVGHSMGGWFANSLACAKGERIRAVATVGAGISPSNCQGEVAALVIHNPKDRLVPVTQGELARDTFLEQNELGETFRPAEPRDLACRRYGSAGNPAPVLWCPHNRDYSYNGRYYPHNWPDGTGEAMLDFFERLP